MEIRDHKWLSAVLSLHGESGIANGEGMADGFTALDEHLSRHGFRLIHYRTDGDEYIVGAVAEYQFVRCIELAQHLGVPLAGHS